MKYKFYDVRSLAGTHEGVHALRNAIVSKEISYIDFMKRVGEEIEPTNDCVMHLDRLPKVEEAKKIIEDPTNDIFCCLVVFGDATVQYNTSYKPAVLICG
jgi:hypothetical protein